MQVFNLIGIVIKSLLGIILNFMYFAIVITAVMAQVNLSIIISILAVTPFTTAFAFYFIFKESIRAYHFYGMLWLTGCVAIMTHAQGSNNSGGDD